MIALRLRKAGGSYRETAGQLAVDVATAYADVRAELAALLAQDAGRKDLFDELAGSAVQVA